MSEVVEDFSVKDIVISSHNPKTMLEFHFDVLENIFSHLDGQSILTCKQVCKGWRNCIHVLEQVGPK